MSPIRKGVVLGIVIALIFVALTTPIAGSDKSIWWWPGALVAGASGGGVIGALLGAESEGESPDEAYDPTPSNISRGARVRRERRDSGH
ncbi:MAG: hypothetical protein QOI02_1282 [Actinomycetota bacterium]|nr:hypothetical protein [Actinomycetota bacterium]